MGKNVLWYLYVGDGKRDSIIERVMEIGWSFWVCSLRDMDSVMFGDRLCHESLVYDFPSIVNVSGEEVLSMLVSNCMLLILKQQTGRIISAGRTNSPPSGRSIAQPNEKCQCFSSS